MCVFGDDAVGEKREEEGERDFWEGWTEGGKEVGEEEQTGIVLYDKKK